MKKTKTPNVEIALLEEVFEGMLKGCNDPKNFFIALHNTFVHGDVFERCDFEMPSPNQLLEMFTHFDGLIDIVDHV